MGTTSFYIKIEQEHVKFSPSLYLDQNYMFSVYKKCLITQSASSIQYVCIDKLFLQ